MSSADAEPQSPFAEPPDVPEHVLAQSPCLDCLEPKFATAGRKVTAEFLKIAAADADKCGGPEQWKKSKHSEDMTIYSRKSPHIDKIYRLDMQLPVDCDRLLALVNPALHYRQTWDPFLERSIVLRNVTEHVYVIQHETRPALKGLVSARDSVDVVTVGRFADGKHYFIAAGSVEDPRAPVQKGRTRTWQYPVGYVIRPAVDKAGQPLSSFTMIFHADLKLGTLGGMVAGVAAPTLMLQKGSALKAAVHTVDVKEADLKHDNVPLHQLDQWMIGA